MIQAWWVGRWCRQSEPCDQAQGGDKAHGTVEPGEVSVHLVPAGLWVGSVACRGSEVLNSVQRRI